MVFAAAFKRFLAHAHILKPKLMSPKINLQRRNYDFNFGLRYGPSQQILNKPHSMFSSKVIMDNWEVIPIITFTLVGFSIEVLWTIRQMFTRHDVKYRRNSKYFYEIVEMNPRKKPKVGKFFTINQKYVTPPGLINALREPTPEEQAKIDVWMAKKEAADAKKAAAQAKKAGKK